MIPDECRAPEVEQLLDHPLPAESDRDVKRRVAILEGAEQVELISGKNWICWIHFCEMSVFSKFRADSKRPWLVGFTSSHLNTKVEQHWARTAPGAARMGSDIDAA